MYTTCFITYYYLPTCFVHFCDHPQGSFTRVQRTQWTANCTSGTTQCHNMLVINKVKKHIVYMCICWFYYISVNIP